MSDPGSPWSAAYRVVTLALVLLTTTIAFEAMAVTTAMPRAAADLDAVSAYGLAFSSMMTAMLLGNVLAGSWADRAGPLPGLYAGQILFGVGAVVCALAPVWLVLLAGRVVCGLGAGLVVVTEFVAVGRVYPPALRPKVFTWLSAAWVVPSIVGAPIAGWLTAVASWRWVFGVVVIPGALAAALVTSRRRALDRPQPEAAGIDPPPGEQVSAHRQAARLGAVVAGSAGLVQAAIHHYDANRATAAPGWSLGLAALGVFGIAWATPRLLPAGTLRAARGLPSVVLSRALFNASFMATVTFLPLLLVSVYGLELTTAGAVIAVASLGWSTGSWVQGRVRGGAAARARLVWLGAGALAVGTFGLAAACAAGEPVEVLAALMALCGLGMGLGSTTLSVLVLDLAPDSEHGQASAALQLSDVLGSVLGIAAATAVFGAGYRDGQSAVFVVIELGLAAVALATIATGRRCAPRSAREHVAH